VVVSRKARCARYGTERTSSRWFPRALSDAEIETLAREAVGAAGAKSPGDMGRVMKELMPKVAGRADGKTVNEIVRRLLAG